MKDICILGAGAAGLLSGIKLQKQGLSTVLIDKAARVGGLLSSFENREGDSFDYGTHFLRQTGDPEVDGLVYSSNILKEEKWQKFDYLKIGTYFNNLYNPHSSFVNVNSLSDSDLKEVLFDIMTNESRLKIQDFSNAKDDLIYRYGGKLFDLLYKPVFDKLYGTSEDLSVGAESLFDLDRIIILTESKLKILKEDPRLSEDLAYFHSYEGKSGLFNYYPHCGGMKLWVDALAEEYISLGGELMLNCEVKSVVLSKDKSIIEKIVTSLGQEVPAKEFLWGIASGLPLKEMDVKLDFSSLISRKTYLYTYTIDRPYLVEQYYMTCPDSSYKSFRVTLYENVQRCEDPKGRYRVAVEYIGEKLEQKEKYSNDIFLELIDMGLISKDSKILSSDSHIVSEGFPVLNNGFKAFCTNYREQVSDRLKNITLIGKASGKTFFLNDTLVETNKILNEKFVSK